MYKILKLNRISVGLLFIFIFSIFALSVSLGAEETSPGQSYECVEAYGEKKCGYGCIEAYGEIKCARTKEHNCVEAYGEIKCGLHCTESYGEITCD